VIIEKTPEELDVYDPQKDFIVCANHFQSKGLAGSKSNIQQINESASSYRYDRLMELLNVNGKNTVQKTISILRDQKGMHNTDIGMSNEKAINQLIAHHSIVFEPQKLLVWVSTSPWQLGKYQAYDLKKVFALRGMNQDQEISDSSLTVAADSFLLTPAYKKFEDYRKIKERIAEGEEINTDSLIGDNPEFYNSYVLAANYLCKQKEYKKALNLYQFALTKEIPTAQEKNQILNRIKKVKLAIKLTD
jgi:tetratricopeptide (TPR) repeat protein